ncbi:suppressor of Mek1-like [Aphidius gifuensis]|uniref:suppressor of Mek1-like n=1 Tax=Aphidius gifuensis TaxID=684658 RepID=UPI001CDCB340|nr:suppressor of Mek1-like [Aphidius gifuensis]
MRIKSDIVAVNSIPRTVFRCKTYRNLSQLSGTCSSSSNLEDKIIEEEEDEDMVEGGPSNSLEAPLPSEMNGVINHNEQQPEQHHHEVEEDDDDDDENDNDEAEADDDSQAEETSLSRTNNASFIFPHLDPPEIKVTIDDSLQQMAHEYREKFDGFAELYHFKTIEEFHEFIKSTIDDTDLLTTGTSSNIQDNYIQLLLNEKTNDKFNKLLAINRTTVCQVLIKNQDIIKDIFETANFDDFPKPIIDNENNEDKYLNNKVEENMKKWYMIEIIGIWLKNITDIDGYRDAIKKRVLKNNWGIENDRYDGIVVPLNYK